MRLGIGLPAAVPGTPPAAVGDWAEAGERLGFRSLAVLDRLVYDNLDPLIALAAAAERTEHAELMTTILGVPWRDNPVVLAKQLASLDRLAGGRLTAGLAIGGWPEDHGVSELPPGGTGARFDAMLTAMGRVWAGEVAGAAGPMPALPAGRPALLLGGLAPAALTRAAVRSDGWIAPFFGYEMLVDGAAAVRRAWDDAGRPGAPRIVAERYFCLGPDADTTADEYLAHYYGRAWAGAAMADTLRSGDALLTELARLAAAGCDDLLLFPCAGDLGQLERLADVVAAWPAFSAQDLAVASEH